HVVLDERSAGFFAVGLGLATGRPALVVTTSGTAAVELHPAVVEASQARVPMLLCTADRPPELHHVGAPQTVEQARLFADVARWAFEPGVPVAETSSTWRSLASRAVAEAVANGAGPGPVHLNLAFRDPLVGEAGDLPPGREGGAHHLATVRVEPSDEVIALLADGRRGVIVAGAGAGDPGAVRALADALGWPLLADPRSGCRGPEAVAAADALLRVPSFVEAHRPEVVLRLGAPWASKVMGQWLAEAASVVLVDPHRAWLDPERVAGVVTAADPTLLCQAVVASGPRAVPSSWSQSWAEAEAAAQAAFDAVLAEHPEPTEPGVARTLVQSWPDGGSLVVSSSMPVRDVEWYGGARDGLRVFSNRGANGIDGVVSTALGVAAADGAPTAVLIGDLAFLHDSNGLLIREPDVDCTFVVVDNDGGGIFSFLPQRATVAVDRFERLFGTPHGLDLAAVARAYGVPAQPIDAMADLAPALAERGGVRMLHVRTDRDANVAVHYALHTAAAAAVSST
ncbi:MAG TPA: 2-succinyl-5-enolpyruvyl-6-hydroxy-3-cyclohexene-1-carboxylic-acid synthase, partial [Acidimicrobiales bacterium]